MFLRITSKHPKDEVEKLIRFAAEPYDLRRVCVNVKNSRHTYRGRAYCHVPRQYSNAPRTAKHLVVIAIGPAEKFAKPISSARLSCRWVKISREEYEANKDRWVTRGCMKMIDGTEWTWMERRIDTLQGYGGKDAPIYEMRSWQEAMVAIAAHEFHHIQQFQNKSVCAERFCERAAVAALERYRATCAL